MVSVSSSLGADHQEDTDKLAASFLPATEGERVEKALDYVRTHTANQLLDTQEPVYQHVAAVGNLLAELRTDADTRIAGILGPMVFFDRHLESRMEADFGADVARMLGSLRRLFKMRSM
ncbi:MAG: HD domain-containing protein, partial [Limnobacter sp.]|nr:HD domain-containing protein [Limnobacter sp.]